MLCWKNYLAFFGLQKCHLNKSFRTRAFGNIIGVDRRLFPLSRET